MFSENLDAFYNVTSGFALDATYDGATAVKVIPEDDYLEQLGVAGLRQAVRGKASDFPAAAVGKTLLVGGTTYTIKGREPLPPDRVEVLLTLKV